VTENLFKDEIRQLSELQRKYEKSIQAVLGISAKVKLVEPRSLQTENGAMIKRFIDNR